LGTSPVRVGFYQTA